MRLDEARTIVAFYDSLDKEPDHIRTPWVQANWLRYVAASRMMREAGLR